jgi:beta-lactamase superfamily II metal-dependent hydrolase
MPYEIDFLQVGDGNGDAICLRYGNNLDGYTVHVIDGGFTATGDRLVEHINQNYGVPSRIEHVVLTHADNDHAAGLIKILENFEVGTLWMNRPWLFAEYVLSYFHGSYTLEGLAAEMRRRHPYLVALEDAARKANVPVNTAFQGSVIGAFTVLAPTVERYVSLIHEFEKTPTSYASIPNKGGLFAALTEGVKRYLESWGIEWLSENPDPTSASNESSIVQLGVVDNELILLTADVGPIGLAEAKDYLDSKIMFTKLNVFQVPHHGSRRNVTPTVLNRWLGLPLSESGSQRGIAVCSLGKDKDEYPRRRVSNACLRRGYPVYTTKTGHLRHHRSVGKRDNYAAAIAVAFESDFSE